METAQMLVEMPIKIPFAHNEWCNPLFIITTRFRIVPRTHNEKK